MTRSHNVNDVLIVCSSEQIKVGVDEGQAWACPPMAYPSCLSAMKIDGGKLQQLTEQTGLDIVECEIAFEKHIITEEDHCWDGRVSFIQGFLAHTNQRQCNWQLFGTLATPWLQKIAVSPSPI